MSNLPGNPDYEHAKLSLMGTVLSHDQPAQNLEAILMDHASATLALAYEQRTANLIAYVETFGGGIEYETVWADIRARLGLGENNE